MRRNLEALYSTLGRGGSALPPSGAAASSAQPTPTGAAGMAEHAWSAHGGGDLAAVGACTLGRYATPTTAVAQSPPPQLASSTTDIAREVARQVAAALGGVDRAKHFEALAA